MKTLFIFFLFLLTITSCVRTSPDYRAKQVANDASLEGMPPDICPNPNSQTCANVPFRDSQCLEFTFLGESQEFCFAMPGEVVEGRVFLAECICTDCVYLKLILLDGGEDDCHGECPTHLGTDTKICPAGFEGE